MMAKALREVKALLEDEEFRAADVIIITDAELSDTMTSRKFLQDMAERGVRIRALVFGSGGKDVFGDLPRTAFVQLPLGANIETFVKEAIRVSARIFDEEVS